MSVLIGADIVPTPSNIPLFKSGNVIALVGKELYDILIDADYRIFNLETPLVDRSTPIKKFGSNFLVSTDCIVGLTALHADLLSLSNNHIMDQGEEGLKTTIHCLASSGIAYLGAGKDLHEAQKPFVFEHKGKRIGVYSCAEHEFSIAETNNMGSNPFDPLESFDHISDLSKDTDYTIVLYHGGKEYYRYPSPNLQKTCHKMIDKGADLVICQHSHCIGCEENYHDGKIVYGQGNFIFNRDANECFQTGVLIRITDELQVEYIPFKNQNCGICLSSGYDAKKLMNDFYQRSEEIKDPQFIIDSFNSLSEALIDSYFSLLFGYKESLLFRIINKLFGQRFVSWILKRKLNDTNLAAIQNVIECETHHELLTVGVKNRRRKECK